MRGAVPPAPEPARLEALTEREREILVLVARGQTPRLKSTQVAKTLERQLRAAGLVQE